MSKKEKDEIREHSFDGIQEYDNDLPRWWIWSFYLCIAFSVIYPFIYDFGPGEFASETVDREILALKEQKEINAKKDGGEITEEFLLNFAKTENALTRGQTIYTMRCFACHAAQGAGLVGPNLADDYWIHGGKITDVRRIIMDGVLEKGMLAWKDQLKPEEINEVTAFIWSLRGKNPPGGKAPQGEFVERK